MTFQCANISFYLIESYDWLDNAVWLCRRFMMLWMHNQGVRSTATIASLTVSRGKFRTCDPSLVRCSCALDATMWSLKTTKHKISIVNWVKLSFTNTVLIGIMCPFTKASYAPEGSRQWFIWWLADEGCGVSWFHCDCFTRLDWLSHDWLTRQLNFCVCVDWTEGFWLHCKNTCVS